MPPWMRPGDGDAGGTAAAGIPVGSMEEGAATDPRPGPGPGPGPGTGADAGGVAGERAAW